MGNKVIFLLNTVMEKLILGLPNISMPPCSGFIRLKQIFPITVQSNCHFDGQSNRKLCI
jgi:hypothetical protein